MTIHVPHNNLALSATTRVITSVMETLVQHGFNYFQYLRCFHDGSFSLLSNTTGVIEFMLEMNDIPVIYSYFTKAHKNVTQYWFCWDDVLPPEPVAMIRERFHIHHGITLVIRTRDYYDMIAFALPQHMPHWASFYINKQSFLHDFIQSFQHNHHELLAQMVAERITLKPINRDQNYRQLCLPKNEIKIVTPKGPSHLTLRELDCLRLREQGQSYKAIAKHLNISPRTVETYLMRVRQRTGITCLTTLCQLCP